MKGFYAVQTNYLKDWIKCCVGLVDTLYNISHDFTLGKWSFLRVNHIFPVKFSDSGAVDSVFLFFFMYTWTAKDLNILVSRQRSSSGLFALIWIWVKCAYILPAKRAHMCPCCCCLHPAISCCCWRGMQTQNEMHFVVLLGTSTTPLCMSH